MTAAGLQLPWNAILKFAPQPLGSPLVHQKTEAALGSGLARAMIAEDTDQLGAEIRSLVCGSENVERKGRREPARAHLAADQYLEAKASLLCCGHESNILRFVVRAVLEATRNGDVELPRQISELGIAIESDDHLVERKDHRRRIEEFVGRKPGESAAIDVAHIVLASLQRVQIQATEPLPDFRHCAERQTAQLELLARRNVHDTVAEPQREIRDRAKLGCMRKAVRHADAHHEMAGSRFAEENANPLQQFLIGGGQRLPALLDEIWQVLTDAKAVALLA